jgi:hypothetical protein
MSRIDRAVGILAGLVLGVAIVVVFVFFGSEGTIDAPRIEHGQAASTSKHGQRQPPKPKPQGPRTVTASVAIAGGAPPASGPAQVEAGKGDRVRLEVRTDGAVGVELLGYGITTTVETGKPTVIAFRATKTGNFPLIVADSHIAVAQIRVAAH